MNDGKHEVVEREFKDYHITIARWYKGIHYYVKINGADMVVDNNAKFKLFGEAIRNAKRFINKKIKEDEKKA